MTSLDMKYQNSLTDSQCKSRSKQREKIFLIVRQFKTEKKKVNGVETDILRRARSSLKYYQGLLDNHLQTKQEKIDKFMKELEETEKNHRAKIKEAQDKEKALTNRVSRLMIELEDRYNNAVSDYLYAFDKDPIPLPKLNEEEEAKQEPVQEAETTEWDEVETPVEEDLRLAREAAIREDL